MAVGRHTEHLLWNYFAKGLMTEPVPIMQQHTIMGSQPKTRYDYCCSPYYMLLYETCEVTVLRHNQQHIYRVWYSCYVIDKMSSLYYTQQFLITVSKHDTRILLSVVTMWLISKLHMQFISSYYLADLF